ncbi:ABC transporter ATP-binding protein [bacterium]|nr:ABC transporter ATP-binding protein [bacterium]
MNIIKTLKRIFTNPISRKEYQETSDVEINECNKFQFEYFSKLWPFIRPNLRHGLTATILLIISSLLILPKPLFVKFIIDNVIILGDRNLLIPVIIGLSVLIFFGFIISFIQNYIFFTFEQKIILSIQHKLFTRVLRFPKSFFDNKSTGYLMSRLIGDVFKLRLLFSSTLIQALTKSFIFIGTIIIMFFLHWKLTLIASIILPFFITSVRFFGKKTRLLGHKSMEKGAQVSQYINESISGVELIKTFATEKDETKKIYDSLKNAVDASVEQNVLSSFSQFVIGLISSAGSIYILWYGATEIITGHMTIGSFVAFNGYLANLYGSAQFLTQVNISLQSSFAALERVFSLFSIIPEDEKDDTKIHVSKLNGHVQFSDVCFSYNHSPVLKNVNFTAHPGEMIAIIGPTGAGKSTLINLIISLYQPQSGRILFDGIDFSMISLDSLRQRIGIVSQETFLFDDSISNNIKYSRIEASESDVVACSKAAMAHEFISSFENGYETRIGERGIKLSVGQKQRISIARVLLKNPDILIFDEPTSALDAITEKSIKNLITNNKNNKTTFVIAHRLSTIIAADKIIILNNGEIKNIGTHEELNSTDSFYQQMCEEQAI